MKKKGFTLVEIMVALVILALLSSGVFSVLVSARHLVSRSKRRLTAIELARQEIENKKYFVRADLWDTAPQVSLHGWTSWVTSGIYSTRYKVEGVTGYDCRKITVQVQWTEPTP